MKARQNTQKGMALVITLMMLAIVTFMAVIFLTLSRRERNAVITAQEQVTSRMMADNGTAAAIGSVNGKINQGAESFLVDPNILGRRMTTNEQKIAVDNGLVQRAKLHYSLNASRNYINTGGFVSNNTNASNVAFYDVNKKALQYGSADYLQAVANLQYNARVPVIVDPKLGAPVDQLDFRYYVDLNRNGMYDPTGFFTNSISDSPNVPKGPVSFFSGDPDWIGVLERPDLPHSETNRFVGRYAYIVLPEGKSLDINFIHNRVAGTEDDLTKSGNVADRFSRNQGVGFWEINLAGFLADFHNSLTTTWGAGKTTYDYDISISPGHALGTAFNDANAILGYRLNSLLSTANPSRQNLYKPTQIFPTPVNFQYGANYFWTNDFVDLQGDGGYVNYQYWYTNNAPIKTRVLVDSNNPNKFWFGLDQPDKTGEYPDVQKYFGVGTTFNGAFTAFYKRFTNAVSSPRTNTYDRYAYYRFVSQMGADSVPAIQRRIHLNYTNEPGSISTNLFPWVYSTNAPVYAYPTPIGRPTYWITNANGVFEAPNTLTNFFLMAANEMLRRSLVTNVFLDQFNRWRTNYTIGGPYFTNQNLNARPDLPRFVANLPVRQDISITNIQIYHEPMNLPVGPQLLPYSFVTNNEYSSALHRILQLAANIYDNMTNAGPAEPYLPSVWRPIYTRTQTNVIISGFVMDPVASTFPTDWATEEQFFFQNPKAFDGNRVNIYGHPIVIGAKKGWPNFNELSIETFIQVGRKLNVVKNPARTALIETNQMFTVGISNIYGVEAWNSYAKDFPRPIELRAQIISDFQLTAGLNGVNTQVFVRSYTSSASIAPPFVAPGGTWKGIKATRTPIAVSAQMNGNSDFRLPILTNVYTLTNSDFLPFPPYFNSLSPVSVKPVFTRSSVMPDFILHMTNKVTYLAIDTTYNRIIDFVTVEKLIDNLNITAAMKGVTNAANEAFGNGLNAGMFWDTNLVDKANPNSLTVGELNQILVSTGDIPITDVDWKNYNAQSFDRPNGIKTFRDWLGPFRTPPDPITNNNLKASIEQQAPFAPTRKLYLHTSYQANDPFVHYMAADLANPFAQQVEIISPANIPKKNDELGAINKRYWPWGRGPNDFALEDYRVFGSDDWQFPIAKLDDPNTPSTYGIPRFHYRYPSIGALGRVHRGTPWQTVYLKAADTPLTNWATWSGSFGTHPVTDWKLLDIFTAAPTENAARGLLSVNQTNIAAWSAVLSGVQVITNSVPDEQYRQLKDAIPPQFGDPKKNYQDLVIEPSSIQISNIVAGINRTRARFPLGVFGYMGEILSTPELSMGYWNGNLVASPYLNYLQYDKQGRASINTNQVGRAFTDDALEAIPQRILGLLKPDETRVVIYSFGQTLKPAPRSLATSGNFYGLCMNYQVTGEYATKTVVRVEGEVRNTNNPVRTVIESFEQLPPFE